MQKEFNQESLAEFDGRDGKSAYIARDGAVYDVSDSKLWKNGEHMKRHHAGMDLSADFSAAPHGPEVLERVPRIGSLQKKSPSDTAEQRLPSLLKGLLDRFPLLARHPHPMLVHFPIAFMFAVPLFSLLAFLTGNASFETTSFHCLGAGVMFTPLTIGTGLFTWWLNYHARLSKPIKIKIMGSALFMLLILILFVWRYVAPGLFFTDSGLRLVYLVLLLVLVSLVSIVGWYGANLTFPTEKRK
ncbi:MAG: DUF2231 domain-containing protein [Desulfobulbales bacterium]